MQVKECTKCNSIKPITQFQLDNKRRYGTRNDCKACAKTYHAGIYIARKDQIDTYNKEWYELNKSARLKQIRQYRIDNKEKYSEIKRHRKNTDPLFNLRISLRDRISHAFRAKSWKKDKGSSLLLGADYDIVKSYIERQFKHGMTWENRHLWHIDHKIPLASAKNEADLNLLCHYRNLQPLWIIENTSKGDKILPFQLSIAI